MTRSSTLARIGCVTSAAAIAIPMETSVEGLKIFIGQQFVEAGPKFVEETVTKSIIIIVIIAKSCRIVTYIA